MLRLGVVLLLASNVAWADPYLDQIQRTNDLQEESNDIARQAAMDADYNADVANTVAIASMSNGSCSFAKVRNDDGTLAKVETNAGFVTAYVRVCSGKIQR